jgi:hypothetical protein
LLSPGGSLTELAVFTEEPAVRSRFDAPKIVDELVAVGRPALGLGRQ